MISGRTNPPPAEYIRTLESLYMTMGERVELIRRVGQFPGGDQALKTATIQDIMKAKVLP
jgi:hypothetical protein